MTKLKQRLKTLCPDGVEYINLLKLIERKFLVIVSPSFKIKRKDYGIGKIPIISQEKEYISGYCNVEDKKIPNGEYLCFGDHSEHIKYINFSFVQGADGLKIIKCNNQINLKYVYYAVSNNYAKHNNYERHFKYFVDTIIPVPPIEVQREIVRILDEYSYKKTKLIDTLNAELTARKKQYAYYIDELLNVESRMKNVEWKTLGEVCDLSAGGDVPKDRFSKEKTEIYKFPIYSNGIGNNALYGYTDKPKILMPCVTIAARGTIGYCEYRDKPFYPIIRLISAIPNKLVFVKYLKYALQTLKFQVPKTGIPQLTIPMVAKYLIPVPPREEQERIVVILDRFDKLCNDLAEGLPAEIEARKKQYEYYRDKLLTFKELAL